MNDEDECLCELEMMAMLQNGDHYLFGACYVYVLIGARHKSILFVIFLLVHAIYIFRYSFNMVQLVAQALTAIACLVGQEGEELTRKTKLAVKHSLHQ